MRYSVGAIFLCILLFTILPLSLTADTEEDDEYEFIAKEEISQGYLICDNPNASSFLTAKTVRTGFSIDYELLLFGFQSEKFQHTSHVSAALSAISALSPVMEQILTENTRNHTPFTVLFKCMLRQRRRGCPGDLDAFVFPFLDFCDISMQLNAPLINFKGQALTFVHTILALLDEEVQKLFGALMNDCAIVIHDRVDEKMMGSKSCYASATSLSIVSESFVIYHLSSVICMRTDGTGSHYYAIARGPNNSWYLYDEARVTRLDAFPDIEAENIVLRFFVKEDGNRRIKPNISLEALDIDPTTSEYCDATENIKRLKSRRLCRNLFLEKLA